VLDEDPDGNRDHDADDSEDEGRPDELWWREHEASSELLRSTLHPH